METSKGACKLWCYKGKIGVVLFCKMQHRTKENKEMTNQTDMLCETRQSKKGKSLDQETTNAMISLRVNYTHTP
ncbi:hypothetical protein Lal_00002628 [Lupinus albus]|nr:hypothetical protein Lal_00002628 [Lupinus albus]